MLHLKELKKEELAKPKVIKMNDIMNKIEIK
jgi:hypothetical protein